jgi:exoribonuclease R
MELIPDNIYLPGHFQAMLPSDLGEGTSDSDYQSPSLVKQFSLHPDGPALTFSAKVNREGVILDSKVEPSVINNVLYLDPSDVASFCKEPAPPTAPVGHLEAGKRDSESVFTPERLMTAANDLDQASKEDLLQLYQLAEALKQQRLDKGAWPYFFPRPSVKVSFNDVPAEWKDEGIPALPAPPHIEVGYESSNGCSVVSNTMVLAGAIAAQWCAARNIPVPFRRDIKGLRNRDAALALVNNHIYPDIKAGITPSSGARQELITLTGGIELSPEPGPYFLLGLEGYAKATSPLRRFADLLVHWQIHAALAHERAGGTEEDLAQSLPFTKESLAEMIPMLQIREKMGTALARGNFEWILLALVQAWKFEKTLPPTFKFTVHHKWRRSVNGHLDLFDLQVMMDVHGLDDKVLLADIKTGDEFEVELLSVNVHSREVFVKALKYLGTPEHNMHRA